MSQANVGQTEGLLEQLFKLRENKTTPKTELMAGLTTFMTMAYIIFVNPSIVSATGMPFEAVMMATIASTVVATLLMAFLANYPFALAPGMGLNAYFTYTVVLGMGYAWQTALGAVFLSGVIFVLLTVTRVRELIIDAVPASIKSAIGAGIGLFIALIGLKEAGIIVGDPATLVALGDFTQPGVILASVGILLTSVLLARNVRGAIFWGILLTGALGIPLGVTPLPDGILRFPGFSTWAPVFGQLDIGGALSIGLLEIVFAFLFVDMFDTIGTLIGVSQQGGFLDKDGRLPRVNRALMADSLGTVAGSVFGTPTVTSYIESASGVAVGGRTGLTSVVVAGCFLLALFFTPVIAIIPAAATSPALVIVGAMMLRAVVDIPWSRMDEAIPAFVAMIAMPFTFSIATGIALAFITYPIIKLLSGKHKEVHWLLYVLALLFIIRFSYLA